jgi:acetyltransferase-like isoleucine patch superfamily enzyme
MSYSAPSSVLRFVHRRIELARPYIGRARYELMRSIFYSSGDKGSIGSGVVISPDLHIELGNGVALRNGTILGGIGVLNIGDKTSINNFSIIAAMESINIGKNVMIAPYVYILDVDHKFSSRHVPISEQGYSTDPVVIEDDVWIGTGVVVTKGSFIGRGAIIGANSVVRGAIPEWSIAAGAPARVKRQR